MPVLDTNLLIRLDVDDEVAVRALEAIQDQPLIVPYQVALEYCIGMAEPEENLLALHASFVVDRPEPLVLRAAVAMGAALRRKGRRVPVADTWIAAAAAVRGDYVVTTNKRDFTRLRVAAWHYENEEKPPT